MTRIEWRDLSNAELRLRLENKTKSPVWADYAVRRRDRPEWDAAIELALKP